MRKTSVILLSRRMPRGDGFHMPAEWEPHERTWMLWPTRHDIWGKDTGAAQIAFAAVANAISRFEPVVVGVPSRSESSARGMLDSTSVRLVTIEQDDAWIRDTGPMFVASPHPDGTQRCVRGVDWRFNAWGGTKGGCYNQWDKDDRVAGSVMTLIGAGQYKANMVLEGGSVHVDGEGTLITTEECLLNCNRNPELTRSDIESNLRDYLGVEVIIWLGKGVVRDTDTDGHVDNLLAFTRPGEVVLHWTDDVDDPQHAVSLDALERLKGTVDAKGRAIKVHKCLMPGPLFATHEDVMSLVGVPGTIQRHEGDRLAASYVNFYITNGGVIVPAYGVPEDEQALLLFQNMFPDREVVQLNTRAVALGGGNVHCITLQQPRGAPKPHSDLQESGPAEPARQERV